MEFQVRYELEISTKQLAIASSHLEVLFFTIY